MKRKRFTEEQIAFALRQAETETPVEEICRKMEASEATFYRWKKKYGGLGVTEVRRSGLWEAVEGRVLIYLHKEQVLAEVEQRYPASHYVMVDDKMRILAAMKQVGGNRLTTVFPRQGHYALDPGQTATYPPADFTIERIGELRNGDFPTRFGIPAAGRTP